MFITNGTYLESFSLLERSSCIIVAGGYRNGSTATVEVLTKDTGSEMLPSLPRDIDCSSMVFSNRNILLEAKIMSKGVSNGMMALGRSIAL